MKDAVEVTQLLQLWRQGDEGAFDRLLPLVYGELRRSAVSYLRKERCDHTLQATDLVHEAYLRLANVKALDTKDRSHFFAVAARAMRRILVDHARKQTKEKRVGAQRRLPLEEAALAASDDNPQHLLDVHEALQSLAESHPRHAKLVELRFFGGFSELEAAEILTISRATISRDWRFVRIWLHRFLTAS